MLALGEATVNFTWTGDEIADDLDYAGDYAVAACAADAIGAIIPPAPYLTGSLQSSVHAARPGFDEDETGLYDRRIEGVYQQPYTPQPGDILPLVTDGAILVGSWIYYAYWVHQGFYNALAQRNIAGRYYIAPQAEDALRSGYLVYCRVALDERARARVVVGAA